MNNPAQPDFDYRPPGSPAAAAYGPTPDQGQTATLAALRALYATPPAPPPAPDPSAAKALANDVKKAQAALDAESDPVQKAILGQRLTQMRLRAIFSGTLRDVPSSSSAAKSASTVRGEIQAVKKSFDAEDDPAEKARLGNRLTAMRLKAAFTPGALEAPAAKSSVMFDKEPENFGVPCSRCAGAKTIPDGNFERVTCPRCGGSGKMPEVVTKGISPISAKLWDRLDRDVAAAAKGATPASGRVAKSDAGDLEDMRRFVRQVRNGRPAVAKSSGSGGFMSLPDFVLRQTRRQTR